MRHLKKAQRPALIIGLLFLQIGCQPSFNRGNPDQTFKVRLVSGAEFVRTGHGETIDGYLVEYDSQFRKEWMFIVLEIQKYMKDERLIVTGRLTDDLVRMSFNNRIEAEVPVFVVGRAAPNIPSSPNIPVLK